MAMFFFGTVAIGYIGMGILQLFGPVMVGLSMFPPFKDMWMQWLWKYLSLSLYPAISFIVMCYVNHIIEYQLQLCLQRIAAAETMKSVFEAYHNQQMGVLISYVIALFIGAYCMKAVPELANMIFPSGMGSSAAAAGGALSAGVNKTIKAGTTVAGAVV